MAVVVTVDAVVCWGAFQQGVDDLLHVLVVYAAVTVVVAGAGVLVALFADALAEGVVLVADLVVALIEGVDAPLVVVGEVVGADVEAVACGVVV